MIKSPQVKLREKKSFVGTFIFAKMYIQLPVLQKWGHANFAVACLYARYYCILRLTTSLLGTLI